MTMVEAEAMVLHTDDWQRLNMSNGAKHEGTNRFHCPADKSSEKRSLHRMKHSLSEKAKARSAIHCSFDEL